MITAICRVCGGQIVPGEFFGMEMWIHPSVDLQDHLGVPDHLVLDEPTAVPTEPPQPPDVGDQVRVCVTNNFATVNQPIGVVLDVWEDGSTIDVEVHLDPMTRVVAYGVPRSQNGNENRTWLPLENAA